MSKFSETAIVAAAIATIIGVATYVHLHVSCLNIPFTTICVIGK